MSSTSSGKSTDFSGGKCHLLYFVVGPESLNKLVGAPNTPVSIEAERPASLRLLPALEGRRTSTCPNCPPRLICNLAHQNRTIGIGSDFRVDGAKSPEIPQQEGVLGSEIAARNRRSLATFHRTLKSQCIIAVSCLGNRAISGVRDGHRDRKSQQSLRFRCAKICKHWPSWAITVQMTLSAGKPS